MMIESGVDVNPTRVHPYVHNLMFIAPSWKYDAHNKCNLRIKPNNLDPVQKGIELLVYCSLY